MCLQTHHLPLHVCRNTSPNSKLSTKLDLFAKKFQRIRGVYQDIYYPLLDIIQHPRNYGNHIIIIFCWPKLTLEHLIMSHIFKKMNFKGEKL